jgi:competence protein ComEC
MGDSNAASGNNESIVLKLRFGERTLLMTGDVEKEGEVAILGAKNELRADVVKVAHHGSRTSSIKGFVTAANPAFAIISVGQRSVFGHPDSEVIERWRTNGATVLTTGDCGMITMSTNGQDLNVTTFVECARIY